MSLPIINFADFLSADSEKKLAVANNIRQASETWGFFYLSNIGISQQDINMAFHQANAFFALPESEKQKIPWQSAESNCGYVAVKRETLDPTQKADLKEAFNLCTQKTDADPTNPAKNKWPATLPKFQPQVENFIEQCTELANRILEAMALSVGEDANFFTEAHSKEQNTFRMLHYPALPENYQTEDGENRAGAHTDYGSITLLFQDDVGGLEVKNKLGEWVQATPVPGAIVVNTGDLMQRWTNDVFMSNPHRVVQPELSKHKDRYSIAYFCTPDADYVVNTVATCIPEGEQSKYEPITTLNHMLERLGRTY